MSLDNLKYTLLQYGEEYLKKDKTVTVKIRVNQNEDSNWRFR